MEEKNIKKKTNVWLIAILLILAIGLGIGGFYLGTKYVNENENIEIDNTHNLVNETCENEQNINYNFQGDIVKAKEIAVPDEVKQLINKYDHPSTDCGFPYKFGYLNNNYKIKLTIKSQDPTSIEDCDSNYKKVCSDHDCDFVCESQDDKAYVYDYQLLNETYHQLFGNESDLPKESTLYGEKKDGNRSYFAIYNKTKNAYIGMPFNGGGDCSGIYYESRIIDYSYSQDNTLKVMVANYAYLEDSHQKDAEAEIDILFVFKKNTNGTYYLAEVK